MSEKRKRAPKIARHAFYFQFTVFAFVKNLVRRYARTAVRTVA
jgi:hypothetical protein